jgi:hypothetical protein
VQVQLGLQSCCVLTAATICLLAPLSISKLYIVYVFFLQYAVYRDMDERAVANFACGTQFFNVWVPLSVVNCDPLAILLPETVRTILLLHLECCVYFEMLCYIYSGIEYVSAACCKCYIVAALCLTNVLTSCNVRHQMYAQHAKSPVCSVRNCSSMSCDF